MFHPQEKDELRARFTAFLKVMVKRAQLNYLAKGKSHPFFISLDDVPEGEMPTAELRPSYAQNEFDFEEERLAQAFSTLPLMRRRILELLFVEELSPAEVAERMKCSIGHVYNQRSLAIKRLRDLLEGGGDHE